MPRGVRKVLSVGEQLQKIDRQIAALQEQRSVILEKKREEDVQKLSDFLAQNHITASDALAYLSPAVAAAAAEEPSVEA